MLNSNWRWIKILVSQLNLVSIFFKLLQQQLSKLSSFYVRATDKHVCQVWVRSFRSTPFSNTIILPGQRCRMKLTLWGHPLSPCRCNEKVFWNCKRQTPRTISFLSSTNSLFLSQCHMTELKCHPPAPSVGGEEGGNYVFPVGGFQRGKADSVSSRGCKAARWHATSGGISRHFLYQLSVCCPTEVFRCANVCFRADSAVRIREVMFVQRGDGKTNQHIPPSTKWRYEFVIIKSMIFGKRVGGRVSRLLHLFYHY